jgi:biotin carboxylase
VKKCENLNDFENVKRAWEEGVEKENPLIRDYLKSCPDFHVEEAFEGELLSVEGLSNSGSFQSLGLLSRILYSKDPTVEMGSCFPYPHPLAKNIIDKVATAHRALGFSDGPTHTEVIISKNGEIEIIDFNPRFVGADVLQSVNFAYGTKIEEALLDFAIGQTPIINSPQKSLYSCLQYVLPPKIATFESIEFPKDPDVKFSTTFTKPGQKIDSGERQLDYLGCYLTVGQSFEAAIKKSSSLKSQVKVNKNFEGTY